MARGPAPKAPRGGHRKRRRHRKQPKQAPLGTCRSDATVWGQLPALGGPPYTQLRYESHSLCVPAARSIGKVGTAAARACTVPWAVSAGSHGMCVMRPWHTQLKRQARYGKLRQHSASSSAVCTRAVGQPLGGGSSTPTCPAPNSAHCAPHRHLPRRPRRCRPPTYSLTRRSSACSMLPLIATRARGRAVFCTPSTM